MNSVDRAVSLAAELLVIRRAADACISALGDIEVDERETRERLWSAQAMLSLVSGRLVQVRRVIIGELSPEVLAAPHNEPVLPRRPEDDPDIVLSDKKR